jgi:hypothetical protein
MRGREPACLDVFMSDQKKPSNIKTALILFSIALIFFVGVFVKQIWLR